MCYSRRSGQRLLVPAKQEGRKKKNNLQQSTFSRRKFNSKTCRLSGGNFNCLFSHCLWLLLLSLLVLSIIYRCPSSVCSNLDKYGEPSSGYSQKSVKYLSHINKKLHLGIHPIMLSDTAWMPLIWKHSSYENVTLKCRENRPRWKKVPWLSHKINLKVFREQEKINLFAVAPRHKTINPPPAFY